MSKQQVTKHQSDDVPPAYLDGEMQHGAGGRGLSTDAADNLVPLIYVLQSGSPQVDETNPAYIPGAKPGDIWLRNYEKPIVKGGDGITFQPCAFQKDWVEWIARERGGGLVMRYKEKPKTASDPGPEGKTFMPNGNELKETRYHPGYVIVDGHAVPFVPVFTSTGHTVSRNWMFAMNSKQDGKTGKIYDSFAQVWRLRTRQRQNAKGKWFVLEPTWERWATAEEFKRGKSLYNAFETGEKQAEMPIDEQHVAADDDAM